MPHEIAGITTCKLCRKKFTGPQAVIVGQQHGRLVNYLNEIVQHFQKEHPKESDALELKVLSYRGLLQLMNFKTTDTGIKEQRDYLRWETSQSVLPVRLTDDSLQGLSNELAENLWNSLRETLVASGWDYSGPTPAEDEASYKTGIALMIAAALRDMRNSYEEPGRYVLSASGAVQNGKIVVPS